MIFDLDIVEPIKPERIVANLLCRVPRSYGHILAVLDTGSPSTIISARDALILRLSTNNLQDSKPISGFGRGQLPSKHFRNFIFFMKSRNGEAKEFKLDVSIADASGLSEDFRNSAYLLPSIIGLDFLNQFGLKLYVDLKNNTAYLEMNEENI